MSSKRKRNSYDSAFKLKVIEYAENHNNCAAEREFGVTEKMVLEWRKKKSELGGARKSAKRLRLTFTVPYKAMEDKLHEWVLECRSNGLIVTTTAIRLRALQLSKDPQFGMIDSGFKASPGWCHRFMKRRELALRQKTHIAQKLPSDVDTKVENFQKFIISARKDYDYPLLAIGNMDETPMTFDLPGNRTVEVKGCKTVSVRTCGAEKQHFTVVLSCLADGTKLKPMCIFKRKTMPKEKLPSGVLVCVHPKGWMDENLVKKWLDDIWFNRPNSLRQQKSLLVWDMFRAHLCDSVKRKLSRKKCRQAVIPGGCTSVLQPLDVCLNKPFKTNMRKRWNEWMINGDKEFTPSGNMKRPSIPLILSWIRDAWHDIPSQMIVKSFKKCCISNAMDGSEDDALYSDLVKSREANGADDENEQTPEVISDDAQPDTFDELDNLYDDLYDDNVMTETEFHELFGDSYDEEWTYLTPDGRPC